MTNSPDREVAEEPLHILLVRLRNEFSVKEEATLVLRTIEQSSHGFGGTQKKTEAVEEEATYSTTMCLIAHGVSADTMFDVGEASPTKLKRCDGQQIPGRTP